MRAIIQDDVLDVIYDSWYGLPLEEADKVVCDYVSKKLIPIEWVKKYIEDNTKVVKNPKYDGWYFSEEPIDYYIKFRPYDIEFMLKAWEKENVV